MRSIEFLLDDDRRRFHVITDSGITSLDGPIELRLFPLSTAEIEIEGRLTHYPRWESSFDGEVTEERLSATLGIPADRFYWFLDRLRLPNTRGVISLDMRVYKEQIALSFDEPWMSQDFAVEHNSTSHITQYHLHIVEGPGIPDDDEREASAAVEVELPSEAPSAVMQKPAVATISIGQRTILILASILLLLFAFSGATTYGSDQRLATFNFLAAVACLFFALRKSR